MDCTRKMKDFDTFTKIAKNVGNLGKIIFATGFENLPQSAINSQSGHTECQGHLVCEMARKDDVTLFLI